MPSPPVALPVTASTSPSAVSAGCTMAAPGHAYSHSIVPLAGSTLVTPASLCSRIWTTPPIVNRWGEL